MAKNALDSSRALAGLSVTSSMNIEVNLLTDSETTRIVAAALTRMRQIFEEALAPASLIAIDLLLAAARLKPADRRNPAANAPTVKELFAHVHHSDRAVRMHFNQLVSNGFLVVEPGHADRRTKTVRLTARGEQLMRRATCAVTTALDRDKVLARRNPVAPRARHAKAASVDRRSRSKA